MEKYFFISGNEDDLAILHISLQMVGYTRCQDRDPFMVGYGWLCVYDSNELTFYKHNGARDPVRLYLTSKNLNKIFNLITS